MSILLGILIFWLGFSAGFAIKTLLTNRFRDYSGTIVVGTDELKEKTVYSLILDDYPEKLEFKKEVVFKVDASASEFNRM